MASYTLTEIYTATEGQQIFRITKPYVPNTQQLMVHVNGLLLLSEQNYVEEEMQIKLLDAIYDGDIVSITVFNVNNDINLDIIGDRNSAFRRYGQSSRLKNNHKYHVNISIKKKKFNWTFSSRYSPLYSSADKIRSDTGELLNSLTDDQINFVIYINSKEADELVAALSTDSTTVSTTTTTPVYVKQWVRFKTCLDLANAAYLTMVGQNGSVIKKIGPINIEKSVKIPYLSDMMSRFKEALKPYDEQMHAVQSTAVAAFTRAGTSYGYPMTSRRSF